MIKINDYEIKAPNSHEAKVSSHTKPLMDTKAEIHDHFYTHQLSDLCFDLYSSYVNKEDRF